MSMNKAILITRPNHDLVTNYLCVWTEPFVMSAKEKGTTPYDLKGSKATRSNFDSYLKRHQPSFLFVNGHGSSTTITGHEDQILIDGKTVFGGGVLYARSCDAGQSLGPDLVNSGLRTFIGYNRNFLLGYLLDKVTKPHQDNIAKLFLEPANLIASTLLKGHTAQEAHLRSRQDMYRNFKEMISSVATFEERYAARWLWSNINSQVLIGNPNSTI